MWKIVVVILVSAICLETTSGKNNGTFPKDFLFGVSTASYQIEGAWNVDGKGENIWDRFVHMSPNKIKNADTGDVACNSYYKYKEDVALAADLGSNHYRFSISWSRILPTGHDHDINKKGILYYQNLVSEILKYNMIPVATIYHWDLPQPLQDLGGWTNPDLVDHFVQYARIVIKNLENVGYWITINEPKQICTRGYGDGDFAPGVNTTGITEYLCAYVVVKAHAATYRMYKKEFPHYKAKMSIVLDGEWNEPATNSKVDVEAAERRNQFEFGLYANPIFNKNWPKVVMERIAERSTAELYPKSRLPTFKDTELDFISGTHDFMGFNTYWTHLVADKEEDDFDGQPGYNKDIRAKVTVDPKWKRGSNGNTIVPWGARKMLKWVKDNYNDPEIFITENGVADNGTYLEDDDRIEFYTQYLSAFLDAMYEDGVRIFGFTAWSLMDNFEWSDGYSQHFGLYQINFSDPERTRIPKKSVEFYRNVIRNKRLPGVPDSSSSLQPSLYISVLIAISFINAYINYR